LSQNSLSKIGVAVSTYNSSITRRLQSGALETLQTASYDSDQIILAEVPGAWELPLAAQWMTARHDIAAVVVLGAVIRGETTHDQYINSSVSQALMEIMLRTGKPIGFGLLTCNNMEQAIHRAGGNVGNKGIETAEAVLAMLRLRSTSLA